MNTRDLPPRGIYAVRLLSVILDRVPADGSDSGNTASAVFVTCHFVITEGPWGGHNFSNSFMPYTTRKSRYGKILSALRACALKEDAAANPDLLVGHEVYLEVGHQVEPLVSLCVINAYPKAHACRLTA